MPIDGHLSGRARQNRRCQSLHVNPRQNEKAAVIDDVLEIAGALMDSPTDPAVPRRHFPGGTGPEKTRQDFTVPGFDEVTQIRADRGAIPEIVIALDELTEQGKLRGTHQLEPQGFKVDDLGLNGSVGVAE